MHSILQGAELYFHINSHIKHTPVQLGMTFYYACGKILYLQLGKEVTGDCPL
jgi:hypothetical protein